jgi:hypothetical protein
MYLPGAGCNSAFTQAYQQDWKGHFHIRLSARFKMNIKSPAVWLADSFKHSRINNMDDLLVFWSKNSKGDRILDYVTNKVFKRESIK